MTIEKKHFAAVEFKEFNDDDLSFVAYASKETVDRDGELVKSSAWDLEDFRKNPVVMLAHDYSKLPIGKSLWEKMTPDGLKFKPKFANTAAGREVYQLYKEGILNAFSVGFIPVEWEDGKKSGSKAHRVYTKAKLLEVSCVAVPSCPDALVERVAKGMIKDEPLKKAFDEIVPKEMVDTFLEKVGGGSGSETEIEKKDALNGQPSVSDIKSAIEVALGSTPDNVGPISVYIEDMYPATATTGTCVVEYEGDVGGMRSRLWQYTYQYDTASGTATLSSPIAVEEVYVPKSHTREKAGRELSSKNLTMLKSVAEKLHEAGDAIDSMLAVKEPMSGEKAVVGDGTVDMDVDGATEKQAEVDDAITVEDVKSIMLKGFSELSAGVAGSVLSKDDIKSIIKDEINRAKGRIG